MKIVSPFRRIEPFAKHHRALVGNFDWIDALRMLRKSGKVSAGVETFALTDQELPVPHYRFPSAEPSLMLWILEVSRAYLDSPQFNQDTVFISPDSLVCRRLDHFGDFDLGIANRLPKFRHNTTLMNGLQFWPLASRSKLLDFYDQVIAIAAGLSDKEKKWGADTTALVQLLAPIGAAGFHARAGLKVRIFDCRSTLKTIGGEEVRAMRSGEKIKPTTMVVDFKYWRKIHMQAYFDNVFG